MIHGIGLRLTQLLLNEHHEHLLTLDGSNLPMEHSLENFLKSQNISQKMWDDSQADWEMLKEIGEDHDARSESLRAKASYFASAFQSIPGVHSVRWRIKDTDNLLAKIIRKKADQSEKYKSISPENYHTIVADLIGVRILHLFKHDYEIIDKSIREEWELNETPIHYIREGDTLPQDFKKELFEEKPHPEGYRSIHYVLKTLPTIRLCLAEVQVRTIFEEGWSEIDHKIRYPNFSDNPLVNYFLTIFNRMAGSADEMGTFVKELSVAFTLNDIQTENLTKERDETLIKIDNLVTELADAKGVGKEYQETIKKLQSDIQQLKENSNQEAITKSSAWVGEMIQSNSQSATTSLNEHLKNIDTLKTWKNIIQLPSERIREIATEMLKHSGPTFPYTDDQLKTLSRIKVKSKKKPETPDE
jgi:ppGpp synthetase/RelA/SpoT-type nucleotidyltranferase